MLDAQSRGSGRLIRRHRALSAFCIVPVGSRPPGRRPVLRSKGSTQYNMATLPATRLKKGMLIKMDNDLFRILDLQHVTPGNLRGFVRVKMRNIRNGSLNDNRFRSEDQVERAVLDERQMQ